MVKRPKGPEDEFLWQWLQDRVSVDINVGLVWQDVCQVLVG